MGMMMRWFMLDKFVKIEKGKYAKAIRNITLGEGHLHDHFCGFPVMPNTLIIESLAQTGGILAGYSLDYAKRVILAKVERAEFFEMALPGDTLELEAELADLREEGCRVQAWAHVGDKKVAEVHLMFIHLKGGDLPDLPKENFVFNKRFMSLLKMSEAFGGVSVSVEKKDADG